MNFGKGVRLCCARIAGAAAPSYLFWSSQSFLQRPARTAGIPGQLPSGAPFTVDDMLDVAAPRAVDLSKDGRWLAATASTLRDRIGIDNSRFGDPTYIAVRRPNSLVRLPLGAAGVSDCLD